MSLGLLPGAARAFTQQGLPVPQVGARNVVTSVYTVYVCNRPGENGRIYFLYMDVNRPPGSPPSRAAVIRSSATSRGSNAYGTAAPLQGSSPVHEHRV
jgi:hypothetical protein